jgi:NAD(P)-dependent dehydrogenase (short-subunit alcohol dehydrogenase family)
MKLLILGATGNMGQRLLAQALERGHAVTAFVRNRAKLQQQLGTSVPSGLTFFEGDVNEATALRAAMTGHDVVINCAGYVADGPAFIELVDRVVTQAEAALGPGGRLWLFGGAAALNVPGTHIMGVDLPGVPAIYQGAPDQFQARFSLQSGLVADVPGADGAILQRPGAQQSAHLQRRLALPIAGLHPLAAAHRDLAGVQGPRAGADRVVRRCGRGAARSPRQPAAASAARSWAWRCPRGNAARRSMSRAARP